MPAAAAGAAAAKRARKAKLRRSTAIAPAEPPASSGSVVSGNVEIEHERIARLAYSYWKDRGCQGDSAEEDWLRAEQQLRAGRAPAGPAGGNPARRQT